MGVKKLAQFSPGRMILFSIFCMITLGTIVLALPMSRTVTIPLIDLFFTATSATCVTGLFTIPLSNFTPFGQGVLLVLIQIGGIGLITMTLFLMSLFVNLGLTTQLMAGQLLDMESWQNIKKIIVFIIMLTLTVEALGASIFFVILKHHGPTNTMLFHSIFHAVSSFCNAGISLVPPSLIHYQNNFIMLLTTTILIFLGGLGFITLRELILYLKSLNKKKRHKFSLHSKIILYCTTLFIGVSTILFLIIEHNNGFAHMSWPYKIIHALFYAINSRSTGFSTINLTLFQAPTIFMIMIISFIGSSPGSTGSGIKFTTLSIFLATVRAAVLSKGSVEIKGRRIAKDQVYKAIAIMSLSIVWIIITIFFLLITETESSFFALTFETMSAFATLGLTTGITPHLTVVGKLFIIMSMIIGRIGSLTLLLALRKRKHEKTEFSYPEERVMLS